MPSAPWPPALRRWGWFLLLWLGGIGSVSVVALAIRLLLHRG